MREVEGKRVLVVGLARSGLAAARCLRRRGAVVTVTDLKPPSAFQEVLPTLMEQKVGVEFGLHREETFLRQDLILVSPGVPWDLPQLVAARERHIPVLPEIEVASWFLKGRLIGITGTNGKTTTTALLGRILEWSGFSTFVGGNIGVPLISAVDQVTPKTLVVTELSSFQLEAIQNFRPRVAVFLNLTPNHLDRHASFEAYVRAKAQIFRNQTAEDVAVLNADDPQVMSLVQAITEQGIRKVFFSRRQNLPDGVFVSDGRIRYRVGHLERVLLETRDVPLRGDFNLENVLAATAAASVLGADFEALRRAVCEFKGVEHRLEFVRELRGVEFYNDSKATSVDATAKALSAFERGVHLILGGKDKGAPYAPLRPLLRGRVRAIYLIGAAAERIADDLSACVELVRAGDIETAAREAFRRAERGDTILLAPACASFDQFQDFEHRGRAFKETVERVSNEVESGQGREREEAGSAVGTASPPAAEAPEPTSLFEVGAEEFPPADATDAPAEIPEGASIGADLGAEETVKDAPLPYEVRAAASADDPSGDAALGSPVTASEGGQDAAGQGADVPAAGRRTVGS